MSDLRITGILCPHLTPFDDSGRVDESKLRAYVDWLIDCGVDGLFPNGSTGEGVRMPSEARRDAARIVVDQAAGRVPVVVGACEANARATIEACHAYCEMGARAVAVVAPYYFPLSPESIEAYFERIAGSVDIDLMLYNIPAFANAISVESVVKLATRCERIVGIKDSSGDVASMMRMIEAIRPAREDFSFLTGWDAALAAMVAIGVDGGTLASSGVVPEVTAKIFDAARRGDWDRAMGWQRRLLPIFDAMVTAVEFPAGFRVGAAVRGWDLGPHQVDLNSRQRDALELRRQQLEEMVTGSLSELGGETHP